MSHPPQPDPRSTTLLIQVALDPAQPRAKQALAALHWRGSRDVLTAAEHLCEDAEPRARAVGADILGQLGVPQRTFPDECATVLIQMMQRELDADVLQSVGLALGHLRDPRAIEPLLRLKGHASAVVRYGVAYGLHCHEDERAIRALIELSSDDDVDVRNWATFALGSQIMVDSVPIREALLERVHDRHRETRGEALLGLAKRGDERVLEPMVEALGDEPVHRLVLKAASELRDPRLRPALIKLKGRRDINAVFLDDAIHHCG
jgi:HEAT repeat protein